MWKCSNCFAENNDKFLYCGICGTKRKMNEEQYISSNKKWMCECGTENEEWFGFCTICGKQKPVVKQSELRDCTCGAARDDTLSASSSTDGGKKSLIIVLIIGIVSLLIAAVAITALLVNKNSHLSENVMVPTESIATDPDPVQTESPEEAAALIWGPWSEWSTEYISSSSTREVETESGIVGYNMVHYGTQMAESPHYRMFRDFSILHELHNYGARESYCEKHLTKYVDAWQMDYATIYPPNGDFIVLRDSAQDKTYEGYQLGRTEAYNFGDDLYIWFIESPVYGQVYRYRDLIPA